MQYKLLNFINFLIENNKGVINMLSKFIDTKAVETNVKADNWREAIIHSGELLVNTNAVKKEYIQSMIENVEELGPYIVIAPSIAMPHARPEDGVKKTSLSLITLNEGIEFGHKKNDPVEIIIALAAVDDNTHVNLLKELMNQLKNKKIVNNMLDSSSTNELYTSLIKGVK